MMLLFRLSVIANVLFTVSAAPALVWKGSSTDVTETIYSSNEITAKDLLTDTIIDDDNENDGISVVFLLERSNDNTVESLSVLAPQLKNTAQYNANYYHSHVTGVNKYLSNELRNTPIASLDLSELGLKLNNTSSYEMDAFGTVKRTKLINKANVVFVPINPDTVDINALDASIVYAIKNSNTVILTAVRSVDEVKQERIMEQRRKLHSMHKAGEQIIQKQQRSKRNNNNHRRLEDVEDEENANQNQNNDLSGVYYVSMTPNILAGILFFFMFTIITYIGITCMNMISGQDTYVKKMPSVGREA